MKHKYRTWELHRASFENCYTASVTGNVDNLLEKKIKKETSKAILHNHHNYCLS